MKQAKECLAIQAKQAKFTLEETEAINDSLVCALNWRIINEDSSLNIRFIFV